MKISKKILSLGVAGALIASSAGTVSAQVTDHVVQTEGGSYYEYSLPLLKTSYLASLIGNVEEAQYFNHYIANKSSVVAYNDDVNGYIDFGGAYDAYLAALIGGQSFVLDTYSEGDSTVPYVMPVEYSEVTVGEGGAVVVTPVGEDTEAIAAALDAVDAAVTGEDLVAALQDEALGLENVVAGNAAEYFDDISDFQDAADSAADPLAGSAAAVQAVVDATNARVEVNAADNAADMETAITAFVNAMTDAGILVGDYATAQTAFDEYTALADTEKTAIAKIMLSVRNDAAGFDANRWGLVYHSHNNGLQSVIEEMPEWINGINTALETADPVAKATAVEAALNNIPASLAVGSTNPTATSDYVYDAYYDLSPENTDLVVAEFIANAPAEFDGLAGILNILDAAIETVTAE